jgi:tetratricopeptide (TPR) repeat protein
MKSNSKTVILVVLVLIAVCFPIANTGSNTGYGYAQTQEKPDAAQSAEQEGIEVSDEEMAAYEAIKNELDYQKRATKVLEYLNKYPKTLIRKNIEYEYTHLFELANKEEKWELLHSLIEDWLKLYPNYPDRMELTKLNAKASEKLGDYQKCVECLEEIYAKEPKNETAYNIYLAYKELNNLAKMIDNAEKILQMPEYAGFYWIPYKFLEKYNESKNMPKVVEWAKKTLKSADLAKNLDSKQQEQLLEIRIACHMLIANDLAEKKKTKEAILEYRKAIKIKKSSVAYLNIGMCQWILKDSIDIDEAMISLAIAELIGEKPAASKAKEQLEKLYKPQHNDTLIGIEKLYKRAKDEMNK